MELRTHVPIPTRYTRDAYPFAKMKVGMSFSVPVERTYSVKSAAYSYKRKHPGWDYRTTTTDETIELWCLAVPKTERKSSAAS